MNVAIIKYNAGNIFSVDYALKRLGVEPIITADAELLQKADKIIFPGVGEAKNTMQYLEEHHLKDEVDLELQGALCQGRCADGPIVVVDDQIYTKVDRGVMLDLMKKLFPEK